MGTPIKDMVAMSKKFETAAHVQPHTFIRNREWDMVKQPLGYDRSTHFYDYKCYSTCLSFV